MYIFNCQKTKNAPLQKTWLSNDSLASAMYKLEYKGHLWEVNQENGDLACRKCRMSAECFRKMDGSLNWCHLSTSGDKRQGISWPNTQLITFYSVITDTGSPIPCPEICQSLCCRSSSLISVQPIYNLQLPILGLIV